MGFVAFGTSKSGIGEWILTQISNYAGLLRPTWIDLITFQRLRVTMVTPSLRAASDWKMRSSNLRLLRNSPIVLGSFGTGIPRLCDGKYLDRDTLIVRSQKGNIAHARRRNALSRTVEGLEYD